jgi:MtN3 and saliva related transmembrane protein
MKQQIELMTITDWIGSAAATLTTIAFIPQAWKVWRIKHTADISLGMYILFTIGVALWLTYGILLESWPIIAANSLTLILAGVVLVLKIKFG